jgi:dihydroorotate dehydrogenase (NAD+) catalytic subunit
VRSAGAEAVTLINTVLGLVIDPDTRRPVLGNGGGGLSGRAIHPVAVRAVHDVRQAVPDLPIVGVGGVASGWDAAELMLVGAHAVQVGTATFADPAAPAKILRRSVHMGKHQGNRRILRDQRASVTSWQLLPN